MMNTNKNKIKRPENKVMKLRLRWFGECVEGKKQEMGLAERRERGNSWINKSRSKTKRPESKVTELRLRLFLTCVRREAGNSRWD